MLEEDELDPKVKLNNKYLDTFSNYNKHLYKIDSLLKREFVTCPDCSFSGTIESSYWETTDIGGEQILHFENCKFCNGRAKIPVKELLDP
ncbi:MAG: hypothetical protein QXV17_08795 [Candidatus Micrarchaeaceae archaeon]